jgi:hypothetical protein
MKKKKLKKKNSASVGKKKGKLDIGYEFCSFAIL